MADIIIRNGYLLTMDPDRGDVEKGTLVIDNGRIVEIAAATDRKADKEIDAAGCVVMPGLVNTHGHLAMTLFRGYADDLPLKTWLEDYMWPAEAKTTEEELLVGARLGCLEMIRSGTTAFADMYFGMDQTARAVEESGLRAALTYGMIDLGNREKAAAELREGTRFAREWNGKAGGRITTMYGPHAPNTCSKEFLERVLQRGREDGLGFHIHLLETAAERDEIQKLHGIGAVELLNTMGFLSPDVLAAHGVWLTDDDMKILAERGVHISHNPVSNMKLASGIAPVAAMLDAGVSVSLGTDGCASNNNLDLFEEMKTAALLQKAVTGDPTALPARKVLEMATVNGARALGVDSGMLRKGLNADVIVVEMDQPHLTPVYDVLSQLVYAASGRDVRTTIVDGAVLMENRRLISVDEDEILDRAAALSRGLPFR